MKIGSFRLKFNLGLGGNLTGGSEGEENRGDRFRERETQINR